MRYLIKFATMLATALCLGGCGEDSVVIEGAVAVKADVARMFSATNPGRVAIHVKLDTLGGFQSIGILCGETEDQRFAFQFSHMGCASPGTVTAWAEPVPSQAVALAKCGPHEERWGTPKPVGAVREAQAMVFSTGAGCSGDSAQRGVELVLGP